MQVAVDTVGQLWRATRFCQLRALCAEDPVLYGWFLSYCQFCLALPPYTWWEHSLLLALKAL
jgi:hypothetical protein